ncbi:DUF7269 family protein [Halobacterium jilantaiense]|uniref:Uncharacterized protein n=1 Tax=Halobacterium jilantaiense TaxID=355548 RepID=A0A1I0P163_9EURY|nr:hypothetical protein [Halobacterium jilantaiense]SEW07947.1 hypothetical protein SAMN04487945_1319 [Halobacterium jilantaiense]
MLRRILLALGVVLAALGFAVAVQPSLARTLRFPPLPTIVIAALAAAFALSAGIARSSTEFRDETDDEDRNESLEPRFEPPRPGEDIDARLREGSGSFRTNLDDAQFSDRLRSVTVRALVDARGLAPEEAERQLDEGTWTDDRAAAAFFAEDVDSPATDVFDAILSADPVYERQAEHVVRELRHIVGLRGGES